MQALLSLSRGIDRITAAIGHTVSWFILAAVLISAGNAIVRKTFDMSSNAWLEAQWYLFSAVFLLAAAYTLQRDDHIRIDVFSGMLPKRVRHWIDLLGHFFMLTPFVIIMIYHAIPFVVTSYKQQESSSNAGGLIVWPAKALVLAGFMLLALQAVSEIIKRIAIMRGLIPDPRPEGHHAHLEAEALAAELAASVVPPHIAPPHVVQPQVVQPHIREPKP
jgi:TRAP-type mannitol/chloroaromatic compound transport system permease small subunit